MASQRGALEAQVDVARRELAALEGARLAKVAAFRSQALAASDFQKLKDDPLSRMTAYQELKSDPKDGATITLFSWMTKFLVIFLEIVPVVAKMFFSPPSVYAARIQATVFRGREEAFRSPPEPAPAPPPVSEPEPRWPPVEMAQLARKLDERPRPDLWPPPRPRARPAPKTSKASPSSSFPSPSAELVFLQMADNRIIFRVAYSPSSSNYHADRRNRPYVSANPCVDRPVSARGAFKCEVELCNLVRIFS